MFSLLSASFHWSLLLVLLSWLLEFTLLFVVVFGLCTLLFLAFPNERLRIRVECTLLFWLSKDLIWWLGGLLYWSLLYFSNIFQILRLRSTLLWSPLSGLCFRVYVRLAPRRCVDVMDLTLLSEVHFAAFLGLYSHLYILFHILRCSDLCLGCLISDGSLFYVFSHKGGYTLLDLFIRLLLECCSPLCFRRRFERSLLLLFVDCALLPLFGGRADSGLGVVWHCGLLFPLWGFTLLGGVPCSGLFEFLLEFLICHRVFGIGGDYTLLFLLL